MTSVPTPGASGASPTPPAKSPDADRLEKLERLDEPAAPDNTDEAPSAPAKSAGVASLKAFQQGRSQQIPKTQQVAALSSPSSGAGPRAAIVNLVSSSAMQARPTSSAEKVPTDAGTSKTPPTASTTSTGPMVDPSLRPVDSVVASVGDLMTEITKIGVNREGNSKTKLVIDLSSAKIVPKITRTGNHLVAEFAGVNAAAGLQRRSDLKDLKTVSRWLDVSMVGSTGRVMLEQSADTKWDYHYYQMERQLVIEVKAVDSEEKKYTGKPLSLNFQGMEIRSILQVIADFTNLNILTSDRVAGSMTLRLNDVPWDQALDLVLESQNLQRVREGNVIWIATRDEMAANNKAKIELKAQKGELEPLRLEFFQLNYYKAQEFKKLIEGQVSGDRSNAMNNGQSATSILSKRGTVGTDNRNNILFVQDAEENLKGIRTLIKKLDIPARQVLIEAKVVIADRRYSRDLGREIGISSTDPNLAISAANSGLSTANLSVTFLKTFGSNQLNLALAAMETHDRGRVLSSPRILTADNKAAHIEQGTEIPYVTPGTGTSPPSVSFKKATLSLDVTPHIAPNGKIEMQLALQKDSVGQLVAVQGGGQIPSIDTKNMQTNIVISNGQTVVLGGVYETTNTDTANETPWLSKIPILGWLFKRNITVDNKGELLIMITPSVVDDPEVSSAAALSTLRPDATDSADKTDRKEPR